MAAYGKEIIRMENISKEFPGVTALSGMDLCVHEGEIHAIVGENGAGKSTLIKILTGVFQPTSGSIFMEGAKVNIKNPMVAKNLGLGAVYQDVAIAKHLTVAENFFLGQIPKTRMHLVDWRKMKEQARAVLSELNININPDTIVKYLSVARQEMVLIAKKYFDRYRIMIFDEPTALLSNDEIIELFKIIRKMKAEGTGIIYISHRLEEIFELSDTVTVIRDGKRTANFETRDTTPEELISKMVGREIDNIYSLTHSVSSEEALRVEDFSRRGAFEGINLSVRHGEILGLFGLVGSGTSEIARAIFGADPVDSGKVFLDSKKVRIKSPIEAIRNGLGLLPEDRKECGLAMKMSVEHNINLGSYRMISRMGFINAHLERSNSDRQIADLRIKTPGPRQIVSSLSGGNQQKVVLAKWLTNRCSVFLFDEPTVGVDVGAKAEIYRIIEKLTKNGCAIIVISSYLPEIMGLADRITVIHEGRQTGSLDRSEFNEERLLKLASGL